jgi:hypothetical protein
MNRGEIQARLDAFGATMANDARHENLSIRAWLYSPISQDIIGGNPLDDLLCVAVLNILRIPIDDLGDMHPAPVAIPVPLAKVEVDGVWIYATSWKRYHASAIPMVRRKRKHFHESRFVAGGKVDTKSGKFRSYDLVSSCMASPFVEWTVRGDRFWISRLLPTIASLGKDRNAGLGTVLSWEIAGTNRDPLVVDGVPQRSLPCPSGDLSKYAVGSCSTAERTVRPPYVWPGTKMICAVPECAQQK